MRGARETAVPSDDASTLEKRAWDYFSVHASQRIATFNFYIVLSSLTATSYFASLKADSNLLSARPALAGLLCLLAIIFWKLDQRNRVLIKNAERALKFFEQLHVGDDIAKVFTQEEIETSSRKLKGWRRMLFWRAQLSYSDCFNMVFLVFFLIGLAGLIFSALVTLYVFAPIDFVTDPFF